MEKVQAKKKQVNILAIILGAVLALYAISMIFILSWGFLTSLKTYAEFTIRPASRGGPNIFGLPDVEYSTQYLNLKGEEYSLFLNYKNVLNSFNPTIAAVDYYSAFGQVYYASYKATMIDFIFNSVLYAVVGALLRALVNFMAAYVCSKYKYKFSGFMVALLITTMTIPLVGTSVSTLNFIQSIGIYGSRFSIIIMSASLTGTHFLIFYAFFSGLSNTYVEAAEIDGASQFRTFVSIIFPLASKVFFTVVLLLFVAFWNNYTDPMLYYPNMPTLSVATYLMSNEHGEDGRGIDSESVTQRAAGCMILALPVLILFISLRNVIMGNVSMGGIKE